MNRLILPLLLLFLSSCKYGSEFEAKKACEKWSNKGNQIKRYHFCQNDASTKKILGLYTEQYIPLGKVKKRFNY